ESGCCAFASDGRYLWATVPTWSAERPCEANDEVWLIDLQSRSLLDRRTLDAAAAGCHPILHPDGETVGLSIGEGQDGARTRWVRPAPDQHGRIDLRFAPRYDRILTAIHPSGREYLTTPHSSGVDELVRHRFIDDQPIARLPAPTA